MPRLIHPFMLCSDVSRLCSMALHLALSLCSALWRDMTFLISLGNTFSAYMSRRPSSGQQKFE